MSQLAEAYKRINALNAAVNTWAEKVTSQLNQGIADADLVDTGKLFQALRFKVATRDLEAEKITWRAPRYGFVLAHAGRGYTWKKNAGKRLITKSATKTDWLFQTLKEEIPELADNVAAVSADYVINASRVLEDASKVGG